MTKLASGYRINKAADDAAGLAISETNRSKIRSLAQAKRNANDGVSLIQVAEGGMNEISNILIRLRELATQAASDTIGNAERSFTNREYTQLVSEIDRISNSTEFNGIRLLKGGNEDGDLDTLTVHVGAGDGSQENVDTLDLDVQAMKLLATDNLGLDTEEEIGPIDPKNSDFVRTTAAMKLTVIDNALSHVNGVRAELGAKQNRLNSTISSLGIMHENLSAATSRIKDVDYAQATAQFTQGRILQQSGVSVLQQASSLPELALSLLR
jgi:flagellin